MAEQASEQANQGKPAAGQHYRVTRGTVGPWPQGHVFSEREFKRLHPVPDKTDGAEYHAGLLERLSIAGVITTSNDPAAPTPPGPHSAGNATAAQTVQAAVAESQAAADARKAQAEVDLAAAKQT